VAGRDHDGVDRRVGDRGLFGLGRSGEAQISHRGGRGRSGSTGGNLEAGSGAVQSGDEDASGEAAGADQGDANGRRRRGLRGRRGGRGRLHGDRAGGRSVVAVREDDRAAGPGLDRPGEQAVGADCVLHRDDLVDEVVEPEVAALLQAEHRLHVALLGPADEPDRVVETAFLVVGVVATGPVGAGDAERQLLVVEGGARELDGNVADQDDCRAVACDCGCGVQRVARRRRGGHHDGIDADAARGCQNLVRDAVGARESVVGTARTSPLDADRVDVEREHLGPRRLEEAAGDLANQPAADDRDAVAEPDVGEPDPVQGDRTERRHRG
jgi:hypothetical protein